MHLVLAYGTGLLHVGEGINCEYDAVPDNMTLCPIEFSSQSLLGAEW